MAVDKSITLPFRPKSEALTTQQFVKLDGLLNFLLCRKNKSIFLGDNLNKKTGTLDFIYISKALRRPSQKSWINSNYYKNMIMVSLI